MMPALSTLQKPARVDTTHQALGQWLADLLMLDQARPRRCARMCEPTAPEKYKDIPKTARFTLGNLHDHARASVTWSCTLDQNGLSYAGVIEIDVGGRDALLRTLAACERRGIVAFAFEQIGTDHSGGHVWVLFSEPAPTADILALCRAIAADAELPADTELWPQNQGIRAPFGFHQRNQTRGNLVLQSGKLIALDTELAAGFAAVRALPRNSAPPAAPVEPKPERAAPKALTLTPRQNAGRASLDDVKVRFAAEHTLESLLAGYGAEETKDGYTCPFCTHTHETTLYIGKLGRLFSYSPNCTLHTTKGWDAFGLYVRIEHNDNVIAAARALNPIKPRQRQPEPLEPARPQRTPAQVADAARKRQQRATEAAEIRASITQAASQDTRLSDSAQLVLLGLLEVAGDRAWCRPSVARLEHMLDISERSIYNGLYQLAKYGYIANSQAPGRTTVRTFLRVQAENHETGALHPDLDIYTDLPLTLGAREGGAQAPEPPALGEPDTLDTWQAVCDDHGGDELAFLNEPTPAAPKLQDAAVVLNVRALPEDARIMRPSSGPYCWASLNGCTGPSRPRATPDALLIADAWGLWDAMQPAAPAKPRQPEVEPAGPGASYCAPVVEPSGVYTGKSKHSVDTATRWAWSNEAIQPLWSAENAARILDLHDPRWVEQEDPLIRTAPIEPEARAQYFALRNKAKKVTSPKQRRWLDKQADELMIWQLASEAQARREQAATVQEAPPSQARAPAARLAKTSQAHQAQLFGGA